MASGIYEILNTANGKRYIGSAKDLDCRWKLHRRELLGGRHVNKHLQRAWNKYGEGAFKFLPILTCAKTKQMLEFYEQQLLDKVKPEYNICKKAGTTLGMVHSPEARAKMKERSTGRKCPAVSVSNQVRLVSAGTRVKMSEARLGKSRPKEAIEKSNAANRGQKRTLEQCANISRPKLGNTYVRGQKRTPAQRENMSRGQRESYARRVASTVAAQSQL